MEHRYTYQLLHSTKENNQKIACILEGEDGCITRVEFTREDEPKAFADLQDIQDGDLLEFRMDGQEIRIKLVYPVGRTLTKNGEKVLRILNSAEDHIVNGEKDASLLDAIDWVRRYIGANKT